MSTFHEIHADAQKTAHEIYGLKTEKNGTLWHKPSIEVETVETDAAKKEAERKERANRLANMFKDFGPDEWANAEANNVGIAELLDPPVHVSLADAKTPVDASIAALL